MQTDCEKYINPTYDYGLYKGPPIYYHQVGVGKLSVAIAVALKFKKIMEQNKICVMNADNNELDKIQLTE